MKDVVKICVGLFLGCFSCAVAHAQAGTLVKVSGEVYEEAVEIAAKVSGKALSRESKAVLARQLSKAAIKNGDDVLKMAERGGLELMEAYGKYGDDVFKFSREVPAATRAIALHADTLVPLTRRLGPSVLKIEAESPGMTKYIIKNFGDDAVGYLSKAPSKDIPKLVGYADHAVDGTARKTLLEYYKKSNGEILKHIDWKVVMAGGLSTAAIVGAYKVSNGIEDATRETAAKSPDGFFSVANKTINKLLYPYYILFGGGALLLLAYLGVKLKRRSRARSIK